MVNVSVLGATRALSLSLSLVRFLLVTSLRSSKNSEFSRRGSTSFPNDIFSDCSKLEAFADYEINVAQILKLILGRVVNIVVKGENAGYQHFLLFHNAFKSSH